jgi:hypothetical protein
MVTRGGKGVGVMLGVRVIVGVGEEVREMVDVGVTVGLDVGVGVELEVGLGV